MSVLEILKYPDPLLKKKALPVGIIDEGIEGLINSMVETMYAAKGIGLAANQVGVDKRVIVLDIPEEEGSGGKRSSIVCGQSHNRINQGSGKNLIVLINPEIVASEGKTTYEEGCLSLPGFTAEVKRFLKVRVRGLDRWGKDVEIEGEGLLAIALQHEIDHLEGILFIDRLSRLKRDIIKRKIAKTLEVAL